MNEGAFIGRRARRYERKALIGTRGRGRLDDPIARERLRKHTLGIVLGQLEDRLKAALLDGRMPDVDGSVLKVLSPSGGTSARNSGLG